VKVRSFAIIFRLTAFVVLTCASLLAQDSKRVGIIRGLLQVLNKASVSGSTEIRGQCESGNFPEIPNIIQPESSEENILRTVRNMFADDPAMQIVQDEGGTIRMKELGVSDDILRIKVGNFKFADVPNGGVYAPDVAVLRVMVSPEVARFRASRKIEWVAAFYLTGTLGPPSPELPHVSGSMQNVTVSEILDRVLKTFPGIWVYENCPAHDHKKRTVDLRFLTFKEHGE